MKPPLPWWTAGPGSMLVMLLLGACGNDLEVQPVATAPNPVLAAQAAQIQGLEIKMSGVEAPETLVILGGDVSRLTAIVTGTDGREVPGVTVRWASEDTAVAAIGDDGALRVLRSGIVRLTASAGSVIRSQSLPVVLIDGDAVRDVLEDPLVARLVRGLSPLVGARVQAALSASGGALASRAAPTLRTLGASVAETLRGAEDPADRAVLATLELYVHQLERALTLSPES